MPQIYFFGGTSHRGSYYFYSKQHNGWVVANLDFQKSYLEKGLLICQLEAFRATSDAFEKASIAYNADTDQHIISLENVPNLVAHHGKGIKFLSQCNEDGTISIPSSDFFYEAGRAIRNIRKAMNDDNIE